MKKIFGFSLVEIVVALIIISVIIAALAPIITKKMKSNSVSITGGSGSSDITTECSDKFSDKCKLCTSSFCIQCELENCISGTYVENKSCSCKTCTSIFPNCIECDSKKCTKCKDNNYYIKDGECVNCPSDKICDGVNAYDKSYCDNPPAGYYCDGVNIKRCTDKYGLLCAECNKVNCTKCINRYYLSSGTCKACTSGCLLCNNSTTCQQCESWNVLNATTGKCYSCSTDIPNCVYCTSSSNCTKCKGGTYVNSLGTCSSCTDISNCVQCNDRSTCTLCNAGYYVNTSNLCSKCNIENCALCNKDGTCSTCNKSYFLSADKKTCEPNDEKFNCSDNNFIRIGKLCITRRNMGDASMLAIPSSVSIANTNSDYCYSNIQNCCWKGQTGGSSCNSENGGYSGCNRTVCNYRAAKDICAKFNYGGKVWRLATKEEAEKWKTLTIGLGENGMMLCNQTTISGIAKCAESTACKGAKENRCIARVNWLDSNTDSEYAPSIVIDAGNFSFTTNGKANGASVRCVTEMDNE